jgi:hypothetical protein
MTQKWILLGGAIVSPLLLWAALAMYARKRPSVLPAIYPWLKGLCWGLWVAVMAIIVVELLVNPLPRTPIATLLLPGLGGLNLVLGWVRRHVEPKQPPESPDGWWPSPKKN